MQLLVCHGGKHESPVHIVDDLLDTLVYGVMGRVDRELRLLWRS